MCGLRAADQDMDQTRAAAGEYLSGRILHGAPGRTTLFLFQQKLTRAEPRRLLNHFGYGLSEFSEVVYNRKTFRTHKVFSRSTEDARM